MIVVKTGTIIRSTAATYDQSPRESSMGERLLFRRGCFDAVDLNSWTVLARTDHDPLKEFSQVGKNLTLWLSDSRFEYEVRCDQSPFTHMAVAGIRIGRLQGSSVAVQYSGSRQVTVCGVRCTEINCVIWVDDVGPCESGASSFGGVCLIDRTRASQRDVLPRPRKPKARRSHSYENWNQQRRKAAVSKLQDQM